MQARDVMTTRVVSVSEQTPVHEIVHLLLKHRISAVPVIDRAGAPIGIVSEGDLLGPEGTRGGARRAWWLEALVSVGTVPDKGQGRTAADVMTRDVVTVDEHTPLNAIAERLERHHIKRVPVLRDGKIVGIVSRANLLHGLAATIVEHHEPGATKDRQLRDDLVKLLLEKHKLDTVLVNVTVHDGRVRLWGVVENTEEVKTAERAAQSLPGVKAVENNLSLGAMSGVPV